MKHHISYIYTPNSEHLQLSLASETEIEITNSWQTHQEFSNFFMPSNCRSFLTPQQNTSIQYSQTCLAFLNHAFGRKKVLPYLQIKVSACTNHLPRCKRYLQHNSSIFIAPIKQSIWEFQAVY